MGLNWPKCNRVTWQVALHSKLYLCEPNHRFLKVTSSVPFSSSCYKSNERAHFHNREDSERCSTVCHGTLSVLQFGALTPLEPRLGKKLIEPLTNLIHRWDEIPQFWDFLTDGKSSLISIIICSLFLCFLPRPLLSQYLCHVSAVWMCQHCDCRSVLVFSVQFFPSYKKFSSQLDLIASLSHIAVLISLSSGMPNHSASIQVSLWGPLSCG